jgi:hypothetical protein
MPAKGYRKPVNFQLFEDLCALQCTQQDICHVMKIDEKTLCKAVLNNYKIPYSQAYKNYSEMGKCSLRRNQFNLSKTNAAMAIFLGKNWLGQTDERKDTLPPNDALLTLNLDLIKRIGEQEREIAELKKVKPIA